MNPFAITAQVRRDRCRLARCEHDLAICEEPAAACPNGHWRPAGSKPPCIIASERPLPSTGRMALNYGKAQARDILAGRPRRESAEVARILAICEKCEAYRPSDRTCSFCGCPVADKTPLAREACPIGKW